jgi:glycosyltransferase involved in cell wall biosynthesis
VGAVSKTVVVIPCYNEEGRLASEDLLSFAARSEVELLFVDDGSADRTGAILEGLANRGDGRIHVHRLPRNHGKGAAVQAGMSEAVSWGADVVGYLDADLSTPTEEFERLLAVREHTDADVVLGSRVGLIGHDVKRSAVRHYLGRLFATAASLVLRAQIYDTQCGAKVFRVSRPLEQALGTPFRTRWVFDVELLARLRAADPGVHMLEVPLRRWCDVRGSKLSVRQMLLAARDLLVLTRSGSG